MANNIQFNLKTGYDPSGIENIKRGLAEIKAMTASDVIKLTGTKEATEELRRAKSAAKDLEQAIQSAMNPKLGTLNISKFSAELQKLDSAKLFKSLDSVGQGELFRSLTREALTANVQLKETHNILDQIGTTMANTAKWTVASSVFSAMADGVKDAFTYVQKLDKSLNDIRVVTGRSKDEMKSFGMEANRVAKEIGSTTTDVTNSALTFFQQGLNEKESMSKAIISNKTAHITGKTPYQASDDLTSVWNGYQIKDAAEQVHVVDALAKVAAETASDLGELTTAMSKTAASANTLGTSSESLISQLATVISVTRQAPESVGTAFKTIYARMTDLKLDGATEDGVSLTDVTKDLSTIGVNILDENNELKKTDIIMSEIAAKWDNFTVAQKRATATTLAGTRQYNNLIALFENWGEYEKNLEKAKNANGTLDEQQAIYMESNAASAKTLKASLEDLWDSMGDASAIITFREGLIGIIGLATKLTDALGGGGRVLEGFALIMGKLFSKQISSGISKFFTNNRIEKENEAIIKGQQELANQMKASGDDISVAFAEKFEKSAVAMSYMTAEERNLYNSLLKEQEVLAQANREWETRNALMGKKTAQFLGGEKYDVSKTESQAEREAIASKLKTKTDELRSNLSIPTEVEKAQANLAKTVEQYENAANSISQSKEVVDNSLKERLQSLAEALQMEKQMLETAKIEAYAKNAAEESKTIADIDAKYAKKYQGFEDKKDSWNINYGHRKNASKNQNPEAQAKLDQELEARLAEVDAMAAKAKIRHLKEVEDAEKASADRRLAIEEDFQKRVLALESEYKNKGKLAKADAKEEKGLVTADTNQAKKDLTKQSKDFYKNNVGRLEDDAQRLIDSGLISENSVKELEKILNDLARHLSGFDEASRGAILATNRTLEGVKGGKAGSLAQKDLDSLKKAISDKSLEAKKTSDEIGKAVANGMGREEIAQNTKKEEELRGQTKNLDDKGADILKAEKVTKTALAITDLTFAFGSLGQIISTVTDKNTSFEDKLGSIVMQAGILAPSLLGMGNTLKQLAFGLGLVETASVSTGTALKALGTSAFGFLGIIGAVAAGIIMISNAHNKAQEEMIQNAQKEAAKIDDIKLQADNEKRLQDEYNKSLDNFKTTGEGKNELIKITQELARAYGTEISQLDLLAQKYDVIEVKLNKAKAAKEKERLDEIRTAKEAAETAFMGKAQDNVKGALGFVDEVELGAKSNVPSAAMAKQVASFNNTMYQQLQAAMASELQAGKMTLTPGQNGGIIADEFADFKTTLKFVEESKRIFNETLASIPVDQRKNYDFSQMQDYFNGLSEFLNKAKEIGEELKNQIANNLGGEYGLKKDGIKSLDDFRSLKTDYQKDLKERYDKEGVKYNQNDLDAKFYDYAGQNPGNTLYAKESAMIDSLTPKLKADSEQIKQFIENLGKNGDLDILAKIKVNEGQTIEEVKRAIEVAKAANANVMDIKTINTIDEGSDRLLKDGSVEGMGKKEKEAFYGSLSQTTTSDGRNGAQAFTDAEANGTLMEQLQILNDIENKEAELQATRQAAQQEAIEQQIAQEQATRANLELKAIEIAQEIQAYEMRKAQDPTAQFNSENFANIDEAKAKLAELNGEVAQSDDIIARLQDTLNKVDFSILAGQAETNSIMTFGNNILEQAELAQKGVELIGEGFTVAAEKADQLFAIFPELADNAQILGNGTIQLNEEVVDAVLGGQQDILNGDTDAAVGKIDNRIAELDAQSEMAQAELDIA